MSEGSFLINIESLFGRFNGFSVGFLLLFCLCEFFLLQQILVLLFSLKFVLMNCDVPFEKFEIFLKFSNDIDDRIRGISQSFFVLDFLLVPLQQVGAFFVFFSGLEELFLDIYHFGCQEILFLFELLFLGLEFLKSVESLFILFLQHLVFDGQSRTVVLSGGVFGFELFQVLSLLMKVLECKIQLLLEGLILLFELFGFLLFGKKDSDFLVESHRHRHVDPVLVFLRFQVHNLNVFINFILVPI